MDEKDKELQELRRKVEDLECRIAAKDLKIKVLQDIIDQKTKSQLDNLFKQAREANTEV